MDPQPLTTEQWAQVGLALKFLWAAFASALVAGPSLLTAHAIIPSAVETNTISDRWNKVRPLFYLVGIVAVACIAIFLFLAATETDWIREQYPRFWQ